MQQQAQATSSCTDSPRRPGVIGAAVEASLRALARVTPTGRGSYRLVRLARQAIPRDAWSGVFRAPGNLQMRLDLAEFPDCCMAYGLFERETERVINRLLRPGDHFVDGGANIGYFTLRAAKRVGASGRVDAFEPQPDNSARLIENLERNGLREQVNVHQVALSNAAGEAMIHFFTAGPNIGFYNHGCSSLFAEPGYETRAAPVRTVRMDEILAGTRPRLVKLDVQGAEPLVIEGMTGLLDRDPPAIIMEWEPRAAHHAGLDPFDMIRRLLDAVPAYELYLIGVRWRRIEPTEAALAQLRWGNLLFLPAQ